MVKNYYEQLQKGYKLLYVSCILGLCVNFLNILVNSVLSELVSFIQSLVFLVALAMLSKVSNDYKEVTRIYVIAMIVNSIVSFFSSGILAIVSILFSVYAGVEVKKTHRDLSVQLELSITEKWNSIIRMYSICLIGIAVCSGALMIAKTTIMAYTILMVMLVFSVIMLVCYIKEMNCIRTMMDVFEDIKKNQNNEVINETNSEG